MFPKRRRRILVTRGGNRLPQSGLLFYSRLPNSEDVLWDEEALWDENMLWGGWILPVECYPLMEHDDGFWFTNSTTPVARTGAEILAWPWINTGNIEFSLAAGLSVRWERVAYIPNSYPFVDKDGANTRTLYGLQYIHLAGATDFAHASIVGTETVTSQPAETATVTVAAGKLTIAAGDLWSFALSNGSTYEFATILTATTGVVFDTSGNGRHLLFTVADTASVCLSGREKGSNYLDTDGGVVSDGSFVYDLNETATAGAHIPSGAILPKGVEAYKASDMTHGTYFIGYDIHGRTSLFIDSPIADYYVDSVNGNDSNDGTTPSTAFSTISALTGHIASGVKIGLAANSYWREQLVVSDTIPVAVFGYGVGKRPELDGADVIASFTLSSGMTNTYQFSKTVNWPIALSVDRYGIWEDGARLSYVASAALVETTPGSFYAASPINNTAQIIYLHPTGSGDPNSNGKVYEVTSREKCFRAILGSVKNIRGSRAADCPIEALTIDSVMGEDGNRHNVFTYGGACNDSIAWKHDVSAGARNSGATLFVGFLQTAIPGSVMQFNRCLGVDTVGTIADNQRAGLIYCHTGGGAGNVFERIEYNDLAGYGATSFSGGSCKDFLINRLKCVPQQTTGPMMQLSASRSNIFNDVYINIPASVTSFQLMYDADINAVFDGLRIYAEGGFSGVGIFASGTLGTAEIKVQNSVLYSVQTSSNYWYAPGKNGRTIEVTNSILAWNSYYDWFSDKVLTYTLDYNCWYALDGAYKWYDAAYGSVKTTLPTWQAISGQDLHSVVGNPLFVDPANGDFNLQSGSPAIAIGAGLLRPNVTYLERLSDIILEQW